jgi:hypothetical protein
MSSIAEHSDHLITLLMIIQDNISWSTPFTILLVNNIPTAVRSWVKKDTYCFYTIRNFTYFATRFTEFCLIVVRL